MNNKIGIGIAGLGTVGEGFLKQLKKYKTSNKKTSNFELINIAVKNLRKKRNVITKNLPLIKDTLSLASNPKIDIVIELIGGSSGVAYKLVKKSLMNGKSIITANKALLAIHGNELIKIAEKNNCFISFEAAIAGGIPVVKAIRENLKFNEITKVYGILNGTCNYILTKMETEGKDFNSVLKDAQNLGFAELDPSFDIKGIDAAHKITLLSSLAFNVPVNFSSTYIEGIQNIEIDDFNLVREFGYKIKLLGIAKKKGNFYEQRVHPCLIKSESEIAKVDNELNAVVIEDKVIGKTTLIGPGAGANPTGAAVSADLIDYSRKNFNFPLGMPINVVQKLKNLKISDSNFSYYLRIIGKDEVGVMGRITGILARNKISIDEQKQQHYRKRGYASIVIITHNIKEKVMLKAIKEINNMKRINNKVKFIRIEKNLWAISVKNTQLEF